MFFRSLNKARFLRLLFCLLLIAGSTVAAYYTVFYRQIDVLRGQGERRLDLYASTLANEIGQYAYLPGVVALDTRVIRLMASPSDSALLQEVNEYLEHLNKQVGTQAIYLIDTTGRVLSSSNWNQSDSFIGRDLTYRLYVSEAKPDRITEFYGIGTTHNDPGYYMSLALTDEGRFAGVAAVKVSLNQLERSWSNAESPALLADENGVIILSSVPSWKYATLHPLAPGMQRELEATQQYNRRELPPLGLMMREALDENTRIVTLHRQSAEPNPAFPTDGLFLTRSRSIQGMPWQLTVFYDLQAGIDLARISAALVAAAMALLATVIWLFTALRRVRLASEKARQLHRNNALLQQEIRERQEVERHLKATQDELVQASKLAVVGQMAAGITHEINQPLAALGTLSDNAREFLARGDIATAQSNMEHISELVQRLGAITGQLRGFVRRSGSELEPVDLAKSVDQTVAILDQRLQTSGIVLHRNAPPQPLMVQGNALRLEQVLINLLSNAIDACQFSRPGEISISWSAVNDRVVLHMADNGCGLSQAAMSHLFEPFFTSKKNGLGLGLTISVSIVRDFGGSLSVINSPQGGAEFILDLVQCQPERVG